MNLFPWFLYAHILGAIIAFGSSFSAFPLMGSMAGREPMHANFAARFATALERRFTRPLAILQGLTGIGLIWSGNIDLLAAKWLLIAIGLYLIALGYAIFVQAPVAARMVELTSGGPPPAGAAPAGPPPELLAVAAKLRRGGALLAVLIAVIIFLMVTRPTF